MLAFCLVHWWFFGGCTRPKYCKYPVRAVYSQANLLCLLLLLLLLVNLGSCNAGHGIFKMAQSHLFSRRPLGSQEMHASLLGSLFSSCSSQIPALRQIHFLWLCMWNICRCILFLTVYVKYLWLHTKFFSEFPHPSSLWQLHWFRPTGDCSSANT